MKTPLALSIGMLVGSAITAAAVYMTGGQARAMLLIGFALGILPRYIMNVLRPKQTAEFWAGVAGLMPHFEKAKPAAGPARRRAPISIASAKPPARVHPEHVNLVSALRNLGASKPVAEATTAAAIAANPSASFDGLFRIAAANLRKAS